MSEVIDLQAILLGLSKRERKRVSKAKPQNKGKNCRAMYSNASVMTCITMTILATFLLHAELLNSPSNMKLNPLSHSVLPWSCGLTILSRITSLIQVVGSVSLEKTEETANTLSDYWPGKNNLGKILVCICEDFVSEQHGSSPIGVSEKLKATSPLESHSKFVKYWNVSTDYNALCGHT